MNGSLAGQAEASAEPLAAGALLRTPDTDPSPNSPPGPPAAHGRRVAAELREGSDMPSLRERRRRIAVDSASTVGRGHMRRNLPIAH